MANPSPTCTVNALATTNGVDVTGSTSVTIALSSTAGVNSWTLTLVGQDELVTPPTVTVNNTNKTATFTGPAPGTGWALIYKSTVNNGVDINGVIQPSLSTTFKISCLNGGGKRVAATNETVENSASFGWVPILNTGIRNAGGATTWVDSGVAVAEKQLVNVPCLLWQIYGANTGGTTRYVFIFDAVARPGNGATTETFVSIPVDSGKSFSLDLDGARSFAVGLYVGVSSTQGTFTFDAAATFLLSCEKQ